MDLSLVPLAQVKMFAIEAEIGAGKLRTGKQLPEPIGRGVSIDVAVIDFLAAVMDVAPGTIIYSDQSVNNGRVKIDGVAVTCL